MNKEKRIKMMRDLFDSVNDPDKIREAQRIKAQEEYMHEKKTDTGYEE